MVVLLYLFISFSRQKSVFSTATYYLLQDRLETRQHFTFLQGQIVETCKLSNIIEIYLKWSSGHFTEEIKRHELNDRYAIDVTNSTDKTWAGTKLSLFLQS